MIGTNFKSPLNKEFNITTVFGTMHNFVEFLVKQ